MKKHILTLALLLTATFAYAQKSTWTIDPAHTKISFAVDYMVLTEVTGGFNDFSGTLEQSGSDFANSRVAVSIKTASVNTGNEKRDSHLRTKDFFNAEKNPTITFVSKKFEKASGNKYRIIGDLTMNGVTKPVTLDATHTGQQKDPWGNIRQGFKAATSIDRTDFGLTYNSLLETGGLVIGKEVNVTLNVQFTKPQDSVN